ncbi:Nn.00g038420.m01.CDS01 [Neocucurbitaria sp. VM-36]
MSDEESSRLEAELGLLDAMYPSQTSYTPKSREFRFSDGTASLLLRLPETYPESGFPDVISATDASKSDVRIQSRSAIKGLELIDGEEALDAIIAAFQQILEANVQHDAQTSLTNDKENDTIDRRSKTVVIWLHHLLNTNKRKLALSPPPSAPPVCGITKPGYPGILIFSGPLSVVREHVNTLKAQNWQAFQVRYEEEELWHFGHGAGVSEVETMAEVVKGIQAGERGSEQKEEFLKAVGIK